MKIIKLLFYSFLILLIGRLAGGAGSSAEVPQRNRPLSFSSNLSDTSSNAARLSPTSGSTTDSISDINFHYYSLNLPSANGFFFPYQRPLMLHK